MKWDIELKEVLYELWRAGRRDDDRYIAVDEAMAFIKNHDNQQEKEITHLSQVINEMVERHQGDA